MKQLEEANAWCPYCDCKLKIKVSQPYRDATFRVEYHCQQWQNECGGGIVMLMEVKA